MSVMTPPAVRERPSTPGLGAAWAILLGMGATSITYNVVHAVHGGALNIALALVYGIAPVYGAALLSHVVAVHGGGKFMQAITFLLMLGAMALSIGATAAVVGPVAGEWMRWLFGIVIDGASLVALRVILDSRSRKAAAMEATERATALASELASAQAELEATRQAIAEAKPEAIGEPEAKPARTPRATLGVASREPDAIKARAAYRRSVAAGKPLTDRALGAMFDRGRTWGDNRIKECQDGPQLAEAK